jgi:RNA polymerase-binding transcription factor DksA
MTKEKLDGYKNKLQHERSLILREIKDFEKPVDFGSDVDHGEEKTDEAEELSDRFGEENDLKKRLDAIDEALGKIEKGDYGVCELCGKEIEDEVLDIDPESRLCKECKMRR